MLKRQTNVKDFCYSIAVHQCGIVRQEKEFSRLINRYEPPL